MSEDNSSSTVATTAKSKPAIIIAPSILASDFANLGADCRDVLDKGADWLHCDMMDGHFVPNISFGAPIVASLRKALGPNVFLDCHMMVSNPGQWVADFAKAGANQYTFHVECFDSQSAEEQQAMLNLCKVIRETHKMRVGLTLKPKTPAEAVFAAVEAGLVDMVLVMSVEPGFGGQSFMADMMPKIAELRAKFPTLDIEVDGGIDAQTAVAAHEAGANIFVAGTSVFRAADRAAVIAAIRDPEAAAAKAQKS